MMIACPRTGTSTVAPGSERAQNTMSFGSLRAAVAGAARSEPIVTRSARAAAGVVRSRARASIVRFMAHNIGRAHPMRDDPAMTDAGMAALEPLIGEWTVEVVLPGAPPTTVRGRSVVEPTLGGRFLVQRTEFADDLPPD